MNIRNPTPALLGALLLFVPALPVIESVAAAETEVSAPPVALWSSQAIRSGESNTVVFWSPGLGIEPRVRIRPTTGRVLDIQASGDRITVQYQAPDNQVPGSVHFQFRGSGDAGRLSATVEVRTEPNSLPPIEVELDPMVFDFGDSGVRVRITPPDSALDDVDRRIEINTSIGTVSEPMAAGNGTWVSRWEPPAHLDVSTIVLLTVSETGSPHQVLGSALLPVRVERDLSFQVDPNSQNILQVGDRQWGPMLADDSGVVHFEAALDPRLPQGILQSVGTNSNETRTVELFWESPDVLALFPFATTSVADPTRPTDIHWLVFGPDGSPRSEANHQLTADDGALGDIEELAPGYYHVDLTPPEDAVESRVSITLDGREIVRELSFVNPAARTTLSLDNAGLEAEEEETEARASVTDDEGEAITGQVASLHMSGAEVTETSRQASDGSTSSTLSLNADTFETAIVAWPSTNETTGLPVAELLAWGPEAAIPADGTRLTPLVIVAVDRFGQGVPGVSLDLRATYGDGWVSPSATTDEAGVAVVDYRAGYAFGPALIRVRGQGLERNAIIFQHDGESDPPTAPETDALQRIWMDRIAYQRLNRQRPMDRPAPGIGPGAAPVAPTVTPALTGPSTEVPNPTVTSVLPSEDSPTPTVASPVASPTARAEVGSDFRLQAGLLVLNHTYEMTSDAIGYAPTASFEHTGVMGAPGLDLRATMGLPSELGLDLDLRARTFTERVAAGDSVAWNIEWSVLAGTRYARPLTSWFSWYGTGHLHRQSLGAFGYGNEARTELKMKSLSNWGIRLGAGIELNVLDGFLVLEAGETFGIRPVNHNLNATVGWQLDEALTATVGFDLDIRSMNSTLDSGTVEIDDRVGGIRLGIRTAL